MKVGPSLAGLTDAVREGPETSRLLVSRGDTNLPVLCGECKGAESLWAAC